VALALAKSIGRRDQTAKPYLDNNINNNTSFSTCKGSQRAKDTRTRTMNKWTNGGLTPQTYEKVNQHGHNPGPDHDHQFNTPFTTYASYASTTTPTRPCDGEVTAMDRTFKCNTMKCRKELNDRAVVTSCKYDSLNPSRHLLGY
jgi:hypothetical protein